MDEMSKGQKAPITVRLPAKIHLGLKRLAERNDNPMLSEIVRACRKHLLENRIDPETGREMKKEGEQG